jgi:hypothetical protein
MMDDINLKVGLGIIGVCAAIGIFILVNNAGGIGVLGLVLRNWMLWIVLGGLIFIGGRLWASAR